MILLLLSPNAPYCPQTTQAALAESDLPMQTPLAFDIFNWPNFSSRLTNSLDKAANGISRPKQSNIKSSEQYSNFKAFPSSPYSTQLSIA